MYEDDDDKPDHYCIAYCSWGIHVSVNEISARVLLALSLYNVIIETVILLLLSLLIHLIFLSFLSIFALQFTNHTPIYIYLYTHLYILVYIE